MKIPVNEPLLDGNEGRYLAQCIETGWISSEGPFVRRFEEKFASFVQRRHAIAVSNGTAAIDAAVVSLGLGPGDEVIMPAFTIISSILQVIRSGATPVLVDSNPLTWNMDVAHAADRITPRTRAIIAVHIFGLPVDMDPVLDLAAQHGLRVIEDAAEMHGQTYNGRPCGSFGDLSTFSFYSNKIITTGEGGMIVTDDDSLAEKCRGLRNLCFDDKKRFVHKRLGWNLRMTNMQAAVGVAQLERVTELIERKRKTGSHYDELLKGIPGLQLPLAKTDYAENIYWVYGVVLDDSVPFDAAEATARLADRGIGTRPFFCPMHQQPVLLEQGLFSGERYPVAERIYARGFYIPSGMALTEVQREFVIANMREILK